MKNFYIVFFCAALLFSCKRENGEKVFSLNTEIKELPSIKGKKRNGEYLYVTAGNSLYSIGNQNGNFPEIGFHVPGEMGGVWQHPIKLLDGFSLAYNGKSKNASRPLSKSDRFIAYPFANQFEYRPEKDVFIERTDFVPDSLPVLVVEYRIHNNTPKSKATELTLEINSDLSPVWLGEKNGMIDSQDILMQDTTDDSTVFVKDSLNQWYVGVSSEDEDMKVVGSTKNNLKGKGIRVSLKFPLKDIKAGGGKTLRLYIGGSTEGTKEISKNISHAKQNIEELYAGKKRRYREIDSIANITIPDTTLMKAYRWGKYSTDWLVRDVPGMGRGLSAGLPDYPWFFSNDQSITFKALVGTQAPDLFYGSLKMMKRISNEYNDDSGRIIHEVSTNGAVYDEGRMEESQLFITAAWDIFKWYGNIDFLRTYYKQGKKIWEFLQKHDTDNDLYVEGYGGVEIKGLNDEMLDVAVGTYSFLEVMSKAAAVLGEKEDAKIFREKAEILNKKINKDWWSSSENRYYDFIASKSKATELIDMALDERVDDNRNKWAKEKLLELRSQITSGKYKEKGFVVFYNGSTLDPILEGIADSTRAEKILDKMSFYTNKYGLYISGIARPDDITSEEGSVAHRLKEDFNYNEAIMTAGTSQLAIAETKYRGIDKGMKYIEQILNNFSFATPGTSYEVSPDYGMFVQAWNISGINIPLIHYIFGVDPFAYNREITINPDIPSDWEYAQLEDLMVGDNLLSIDYTKNENNKSFTITSSRADWVISFELPKGVKGLRINGKEIHLDSNLVTLKGEENTIEFLN